MADEIDVLDAPADTGAAAGGDKGGGDKAAPADNAGAARATGKQADADAGATDDAADGDGGKPAPKARGARGGKAAKADAKATDDAAAAGKSAGKAAAQTDDELGFEDDDEEGGAPASWPNDWREKLANGNDKLAKRLSRFTSPEALLKSWQSLEQKLSSGEYKKASLPDDATDEEKAEWRQANGIPDTPEGYEFPTIKGHEWGDADKAIASQFLADLHAAGTPKPIAQAALGWYAKFQQQTAEARATQDLADREAREDALRTEWGPKDYRPHIKLATDTLNDPEFIPPELKGALMQARMPDGRRLALMPEFTRFLAERGLERRGPAGLISGEQGTRMGGRIDEIKKIMQTDMDRYYAEGLDKELIELQTKMESAGGRR